MAKRNSATARNRRAPAKKAASTTKSRKRQSRKSAEPTKSSLAEQIERIPTASLKLMGLATSEKDADKAREKLVKFVASENEKIEAYVKSHAIESVPQAITAFQAAA